MATCSAQGVGIQGILRRLCKGCGVSPPKDRTLTLDRADTVPMDVACTEGPDHDQLG